MAHLELISAGEPVCVWTEPSRNFTIRLHPGVLERLGTESGLAVETALRHGLEMGGILLGHVESQGDTTTFWIEGYQPEPDVARLHGARAKKGAKGIGIYRSQTRSQRLALQAPDLELLERCFDTSDALFLLLDPVPGTAAFFIRTDGNVNCVHKFALAPPQSPVDVPRPTRTSPKGPSLAALITTLVLVSTVIGISYFLHPSAPPQRAFQRLQLNVERAGPGLRLLWDRNSSAMRGASHAVVHIRDGDRQNDRDLTPAELNAGNISYEPRSSEVAFRLDVYSVKPNVTGSVVAVNLLSPSTMTSARSGESKWRQAPKQ